MHTSQAEEEKQKIHLLLPSFFLFPFLFLLFQVIHELPWILAWLSKILGAYSNMVNYCIILHFPLKS